MTKLELIKNLLIGGFAIFAWSSLAEATGMAAVKLFDWQYIGILGALVAFAVYLYQGT